MCESSRKECNNSECYTHHKDFHALYIDDLAEGEAIDLKKQLVVDPSARPAPLTYYERSGHVMPAG